MKNFFHPPFLTVASTFSNRPWVKKLLQSATFRYFKFFSRNFFSVLKSDQAAFKSHDQILSGLTFLVMKNFFYPLVLTVAPTFSNRSWVKSCYSVLHPYILNFFLRIFSVLKSGQAAFKSHDQMLTGTNYFGHEKFFLSPRSDSCTDSFLPRLRRRNHNSILKNS